MFGFLKNLVAGGELRQARVAVAHARIGMLNALQHGIKARYDSAQSTDENKRLWAYTDVLSPKAANNYGIRRTLRMRARYEVANNSYAFGIINTDVCHLIGTGPVLQSRFLGNNALNRSVERRFAEWALEVDLIEKLRIMSRAKKVDGEGFLILKNNGKQYNSVKLYPMEIECDQVTTPNPQYTEQFWVDGIVLDKVTGLPESYVVLKTHPGELFYPNMNPLDYDSIKASNVVHWFRKDRPGQVRGIPELTPALDLFGKIRAYRESVLASARIAAAHTVMLKSILPPGYDDDAGPEEDDEFKTFPVDNGMMTVLPAGYDATQMRPEQPQAQFDSFTEKLIAEACRVLDIPLNLALGTSQKFNFSSARLDHINYRGGKRVERSQCDKICLRKIYTAFIAEGIRIPKYFDNVPSAFNENNCPHKWFWPGFEPLDPKADAEADAQRLADGTVTADEYYAEQGKDWEDVYKQLALEDKTRQKYGLHFGIPGKVNPNDDPADIDDTDTDTETEKKPKDMEVKPKKTESVSEKVVKKNATADIQNTALNGAQVTSLVAVCDKLAAGDYTGDATKAIIKGAFPGFSDDLINTIVGELEDHVNNKTPEPEGVTDAA